MTEAERGAEMAEPTPGPWRLSRSGLGVTDGRPDGDRGFPDGRTVATTKNDLPTPERLANAMLMAAAPELLAACEQALESMDGPEADRRERLIVEELRAALIKAKGG